MKKSFIVILISILLLATIHLVFTWGKRGWKIGPSKAMDSEYYPLSGAMEKDTSPTTGQVFMAPKAVEEDMAQTRNKRMPNVVEGAE